MENLKKEILQYFNKLKFVPKEHKYSVEGKNIKLSVSGIIKKFVEPFDTETISLRVASRRGISQEDVLKEWENKKNKACNRGTDVHLFGELYPLNKKLIPSNGFEKAVVNFWKDLPKEIIPLILEIKMYHKKFLYAGTADILLYNTKTKSYHIGDYKTNIDLFKNFRGKKMLGIFNNLLDSPYNHYQLQLSFYQILFEQIGLKISSRKLIWLKPDGSYTIYDTEDYTDVLKDYLKNNKVC